MPWTKQQQKVIDQRDADILVSAAAGSGKTAVLVERIIQKITDEKHPIDVDHLLVVTLRCLLIICFAGQKTGSRSTPRYLNCI